MIERRSPRSATPLPLSIATCLLLTLVSGAPAAAQDVDDEWTVTLEAIEAARSAPLFQTDDVLELTLYADFNSIRRQDRGGDAEERPALVHVDAEGSEATLELKIQTRGNWRRDSGNCAFPPLWLDFDRDDEALVDTVFKGQNRLKLYVTCRPGRDDYERYIYSEYVIYPAYNVLTDLSFRARPPGSPTWTQAAMTTRSPATLLFSSTSPRWPHATRPFPLSSNSSIRGGSVRRTPPSWSCSTTPSG